MLEPHGRRIDEGFTEARVLAEVSLLPEKVRITSGRRAVAMAAGVVDRSFMHGEVKKKKVFVVVTSGWSIMCFDHNLKKLWEQNLQACVFCLIYLHTKFYLLVLVLLGAILKWVFHVHKGLSLFWYIIQANLKNVEKN